jgi:hypothetical protein
MKTVEATVIYQPPRPHKVHGDGFVVTLPKEVEPFDFIQAGYRLSVFEENHPIIGLLGCASCHRWRNDPAEAEKVIAPQYGHIRSAENAVEIVCEGSHLYADDDCLVPCVSRFSSGQKVEVEVRDPKR